MIFSVVIGTYNQTDKLPYLIESLNDQTLQDFDVHLCSDGSKDRESEEKLLEGLKMPHYYHWQEDIGMRFAKNLNQGIKVAQGKFVLTMSGDMYLENEYLERCARVVSRNTLFSTFRINVDDNRKPISYDWRFGGALPETLEEIIYPENPKKPWEALTGNGMITPTEFYRKIGGWCEEFEGYGRDDWDVIRQAYLMKYKFFTLTTAHYFHFGVSDSPDNPKNIELFERRLNENKLGSA